MKPSMVARLFMVIAMTISFGMLAPSFGFAGPCEGDILAFCPGAEGPRQILPCLRQNGPQLSPPCQMQLQQLQEAINQTHQDCEEDIFMLCLGVPPGPPLIQCMRLNKDYISPTCKAAILDMLMNR